MLPFDVLTIQSHLNQHQAPTKVESIERRGGHACSHLPQVRPTNREDELRTENCATYIIVTIVMRSIKP